MLFKKNGKQMGAAGQDAVLPAELRRKRWECEAESAQGRTGRRDSTGRKILYASQRALAPHPSLRPHVAKYPADRPSQAALKRK